MTKMLDAALQYLRRGWSVFPCNGKRPHVKWQQYSQQAPSEEQVREWWTRWPDANIAVACGAVSNLVVIDIDPDRGGDVKGLEETNLVSRTGGGGWHYFYTHPGKHVPNRVGRDDGIDVRGDGGYVILPPSLHSSGGRYRWQYEGKPAVCPSRLTEKPRSSDPGKDKWIVNLLEGGTDKGSRNDDVARLAGYFAKKEVPVDVAESIIKGWMTKQPTPLHESEVETTVGSVYKTASRRSPNKRQQPDSSDESPFAVVDIRKYMLRYGSQEISWLVKDWLPAETIAFTASPPGGLKTWTMLDLAVSVASGKPFFGDAEVSDPGPVLLIQQEDFHGQIAERLAVIAMGKYKLDPATGEGDNFDSPLVPELPIYVHPDRRLRFSDANVLDGLEDKIKTIRPRLVIIDPLYSAADMDDYGTKSAGDMFVLKTLRDKYKTSFFIAHHTRKSSESWDRQDMWGSQFLNAFLETGWQVRRKPDEEAIIIKRHFKGAPAGEPVQITFNINTTSAFHYATSVEEVDASEAEQVVQKVLNSGVSRYLEPLQEHGPCTIAELADAMGKNRSSVSRALKKLHETGQAVKDDEGKWKYVETPEF